MEYNGKIYGKVGQSYFPLTMTSEDVDKLQDNKKELLAACQAALLHHQGGHSEIGSILKEAIKKATE